MKEIGSRYLFKPLGTRVYIPVVLIGATKDLLGHPLYFVGGGDGKIRDGLFRVEGNMKEPHKTFAELLAAKHPELYTRWSYGTKADLSSADHDKLACIARQARAITKYPK